MIGLLACRRTLAVIALILVSSAALADDNLLPNAGFEINPTDYGDKAHYWPRDVGGGVAYDPKVYIMEWDSAVSENGGHSVRIERKPGAEMPARWFRIAPVEAGETYRFSASYLTGRDFGGPAGLMVNGLGLDQLTEQIPPPAPGSANVWRRVEISFAPEEAGGIYLFMEHRGSGTIWYDNATLEKLPPSEKAPPYQMTNLVRNPGMEKIGADGLPADGWWTYPSRIDPKVARITADTTVAHSGKASARFEMKSLGSATLVSPSDKVNPGDTLYFAVHYRSNLRPAERGTEALDKAARAMHRSIEEPMIRVLFSYRNNISQSYKSEMVAGAKPVTNGWEKLEGTFTAPVGAVRTEVEFMVLNFVGDFWIDDLVVRKTAPFSLNAAPYEEKKGLGKNRLDLVLENYTGAKTPIKISLTFRETPVGAATITPSGAPREKLSVDYELAESGSGPLKIVLSDQRDNKVLCEVAKELTVAAPLATGIPLPTHVWPNLKVEKVTESIEVARPAEQLKELKLVVQLFRGDEQIRNDVIPNVLPKITHALPIAGLPPGKYLIRTILLGKDGNETNRTDETFQIMDSPRPAVEVKSGQLLVEGKPFFPIGMFSPSTERYKEYAEAGFNFAHNYAFDGTIEGERLGTERGCLAIMDQAQEAGLWFVVSSPAAMLAHQDWDGLRARYSVFKDHPAVLCYEEEEQMVRYGFPLEAAVKWRQLLRELDPGRPVLFGDALRPETPESVKKLPVDVMDMGVMWWYPFPLSPGQTEIGIPDWLPANLALTDKPIWVAPQSWKNNMIPDGRWPLPEEYRVQAYLAIIHGAKGLMYFGGHIFGDPQAGHWDALKKVVGELRELSPVLVDATSKEKVAATGAEKISLLLKEHAGKYYLLTANRDAATVNAAFTLPFKPAGITVMFEDRKIAPADNTFKDTFSKYAVHVYEISTLK